MPSGSTFVENLKGWQLWTEFKAFRFAAAFKQPLWKAFWVAVILGTFAAFIIQSVYILVDYTHYNIDTVVQLKSIKGLPFPAVTICNLNPIRKSAMDYVEELSDLQTIYNYLSQKKAHESGVAAFSGTSRKKSSANDELSMSQELYDVSITADPSLERRPKRRATESTCSLSPSGLSPSTMSKTTTEAPTTKKLPVTTTAEPTKPAFLARTPTAVMTPTFMSITSTVAHTTSTAADTTTAESPATLALLSSQRFSENIMATPSTPEQSPTSATELNPYSEAHRRFKRSSTACDPSSAYQGPLQIMDGVQGTSCACMSSCTTIKIECYGLDPDGYTTLLVALPDGEYSYFDDVPGVGPIVVSYECVDDGNWMLQNVTIPGAYSCESTSMTSMTSTNTTTTTTTETSATPTSSS